VRNLAELDEATIGSAVPDAISTSELGQVRPLRTLRYLLLLMTSRSAGPVASIHASSVFSGRTAVPAVRVLRFSFGEQVRKRGSWYPGGSNTDRPLWSAQFQESLLGPLRYYAARAWPPDASSVSHQLLAFRLPDNVIHSTSRGTPDQLSRALRSSACEPTGYPDEPWDCGCECPRRHRHCLRPSELDAHPLQAITSAFSVRSCGTRPPVSKRATVRVATFDALASSDWEMPSQTRAAEICRPLTINCLFSAYM